MKAYDLTYLLRRVALLVLAAIGVHQLRYLLAYGADSAGALSQQGHGYLATLLPDLVGVATVLVIATVVGRLLARHSSSMTGQRRGLPQWLLLAAAIFAIFACQETIEGLVAVGHPSGIAALLASGGWIAAPLALVFGVLVALALRLLDGADRVLGNLVVTYRPRRGRATAQATPRQPAVTTAARLALAFGFARRPPPLPIRSI